MKGKLGVFIALFSAMVLLSLGMMASFWFFAQLRSASELRRDSIGFLTDANHLMAGLIDAETGQRGFLLTGDEAFLKPYRDVQATLEQDLQSLLERNKSPAAQIHLEALKPLVKARLAGLSGLIELRRQNDTKAAFEAVRTGAGMRLTQEIRTELGNFITVEESELQQHELDFTAKLQQILTLILFACFCFLLLLFWVARLIYQQSQQGVKTLVLRETQALLKIQDQSNCQLKLANATLLMSEEKLSVTLKSIGDAVIATDSDARVSLLNPVAALLTGWTQEQAMGQPIADVFNIISKHTREPAQMPVLETLAHGTIQGLANHTVLIAKDGTERDIADSCAPILDRDRKVIGAVLVFRDVSQDYAVQQKLTDSAELIQTVLNTVADSITTLHAKDGAIEKVNPAAEHMFGYSAHDLHRQNFSLLFSDVTASELSQWLEACQECIAAAGSGHGREVIGKRQDGSSFPMEIAVSEMWLGGERYFTGILRDISVRRAAETALIKAGALQNAIFNSANFSSIATDAKGVIQIFNVGAERMLGYAASDVMNQLTPADISDPGEVIARAATLSLELGTPIAPGFEALVFKASRGIEDIYELSYIRKDGSRFPAIVSVTALRDAGNLIIGYLLIGTDNTARKQVEAERSKLDQRLRDQQFYTRSLIESSIDALMTTDPAGIITDVNKQMESLTGCTRDELIGAPFKNYFTDPERAEAGIRRVLAENRVINYELTVQARTWQIGQDGQNAGEPLQETVVSYNASTFFDRDRNLQGVFAAARDITERKRLDLILQDNNVELISAKLAADKANLAKSEFLSSMSHELRTPLNAILGFAQLLEVGTPPLSAGQKRSVEHILHAGWYLLDLINEILDLALIESGKLSLSTEPVKLADVLHECQALIERQARKRGVKVSFPKPGSDPGLEDIFIKADRTRLKQVLLNLLSNAVKYNHLEGSVAVTLQSADLLPIDPHHLDASHIAEQPHLRICVNDTGNGLSPDKIAQLFQPFNRLGQEANAEEGTGIGLVVSKRLIELMHGRIGVESSAGSGCTFWIELALSPVPTAAELNAAPGTAIAIQSDQSIAPLPKQTLLYVEDNPANMLLVQEITAQRSHLELIAAKDAITGIELARSRLPTLILMDINLPGMSGIEALAVLLADSKTAHIPVIALSANAIPRDIEKGLEAGFFQYLTKPIKVLEFLDSIDVALAYAEKTSKEIAQVQ